MILGVLAYFVFIEHKIYFLLAEAVLIGLGLVAFQIYRNIFRPINLIQQGIAVLKDEDFNVKLARTGIENMDDLINVYNQMIDKIRHERTYQQEQHFFLKLLVDALPVSVIILDYDGNVSEFNPMAQETLRLNMDIINKPIASMDHSLGSALMNLKEGEPVTIKTEGINHYSCFVNKFMHRGFSRKFLVIQELSGEILTAEKKAYGKVIRMMAHEVNNSIGAINSILYSITEQEPIDNQEAKEYLPIVIERNERLNQFMKNFAKVVRLPLPRKVRLNLNKLVGDVFNLMKVTINDAKIDFNLVLPEEVINIVADREQLEQVFINVLLNAAESVQNNGQINVTLESRPSQLTISDNGVGITPEVSKKLFTPFFSTKPDGQGIGLTLIREILHNHDFNFSLKTKDGITSFVIQF